MRAINAALVSATLFFLGCSGFGLTGNGQVRNETRQLRGFESVSVSGSGNLRLHSGSFKVVVTSDSNILPYITTEVSGSTLKIGLKPGTSLVHVTKLEYDVTLPSLEGISISGSSDCLADDFSGKDLAVDISGSGSVKGGFDYARVSVGISGSGNLDLDGNVGALKAKLSGSGDLGLKGSGLAGEITLSGSGRISARDFPLETLSLGVSGAGFAEVRVRDKLSVSGSGACRVRYWGKPELTQHLSGASSVEKAGD